MPAPFTVKLIAMADEEVALQPPKLWIGELYYYFALIGEKLGPAAISLPYAPFIISIFMH